MKTPSSAPAVRSAPPFPRWAPWLFAAPWLLVFGTFVAWPLVRSLMLSFMQTFGPGTTTYVGWDNFRYLFHDPLFYRALWNTFLFTLGSVFIQLPIALALALLLNRPTLRGRSVYRLLFFLPSLVGLVFAGVLVAIMFEKRTGLVDAGLHAVFTRWDPDFPWLEQYVMPSLIIAGVWLYAGFNMVYFLAALQHVSSELLDAAAIDGAGPWQRFWHVTLPEIRPVAGLVVLLSVAGSFQLFELPYIMFNTTGNPAGPDNSALTVVMYLYQMGFMSGDLGYASAIGWVLAVLLMGLAALQRWLARREEY